MNRTHNAHRAIALLMAAVALPAIPAVAQEAAPPPVSATVPAPAPAPVAAPPAAQAPVFAPRQEVVQPLPVRSAPPVVAEGAAPAPRAQAMPAPRRASRATVERTPTAAAPAVAAPVAAAPVAEAAPTPVTPEGAPLPAPVPDPTPDVAATESTATSTTSIPWLWIGLGVLALAALAALFGRGRRNRVDEVYDDAPVAITPVAAAPVVAPIVAAPIAQPVMTPTTVAPQTVAAATAVADDERPWIGLSIWPKQVDSDGNIQYDLVVENAGEVEAHDVRVSSFLIDGTNSSPMESALIGGSETRSVDIRAGASVQIAQTMTAIEGVSPRIIAEARYPLPDGGEGHIAARFVIDTARDGSVEARLDDLLERV